MSELLTPEREADIRKRSESWSAHPWFKDGAPERDIRDLLAELDAVRKERDEAEARGRAAERADAVAWIDESYDDNAWFFRDGIDTGKHVGASAKGKR